MEMPSKSIDVIGRFSNTKWNFVGCRKESTLHHIPYSNREMGWLLYSLKVFLRFFRTVFKFLTKIAILFETIIRRAQRAL